ncbi:hypothetical protein TNIN_314031 [Trichonephila inaurata madagascariensis]|uniref:Uncharacterized protein n=1 Tax=Trichonephila inaurata madagascariensis TaxID=2747483 RepID=A0A8X6XV43_9ARAC|nr:hypothetical protein TNIN_314031 [Trichonephila inaurata madagascariensis]
MTKHFRPQTDNLLSGIENSRCSGLISLPRGVLIMSTIALTEIRWCLGAKPPFVGALGSLAGVREEQSMAYQPMVCVYAPVYMHTYVSVNCSSKGLEIALEGWNFGGKMKVKR